MMKLELEILGAFCATGVFNINGVTADYEDFGSKDDISPHTAEDYSCGNMQFTPTLPNESVLSKYSIGVADYSVICEKLDGLSFGSCGWCS